VVIAGEKLKKECISFDFRFIEGMDHQETMNLLSKADIVIDQLRIGASGYLSTEAMALGKPVICYIREDLVDAYPKDFPIVNAHPNTLKYVLQILIQNPAKWT